MTQKIWFCILMKYATFTPEILNEESNPLVRTINIFAEKQG